MLNNHNANYQVIASLDDQDVDFEEYQHLMQLLDDEWSNHIASSAQGFRFDSQAVQIALSALKSCGVSIVYVEGPAYKYVMSQASKIENAAILGYDSIYLSTDFKFYFIDSLYEDKQGALVCSVGSGAAIREKLGLTIEQYQILLSLLPNHVQQETQLNYFFQSLADQQNEQIDPNNRCIVNLAKFILETPQDQLTAKLIENEKQCLIQDREKINQKIEQIKVQQQDFENKQKELEGQVKSPANIKRMENYKQNVIACKEEIQAKTEQLQSMKEENITVDLSIVHQLFDQLPIENSLKEKLVPEAPYINNFIKQGKLATYVYHAIKEKKDQFSPEFEPLETEAASLMSQKIRNVIYGLVGLQQVTESVKGNGQMIDVQTKSIDCGLISKYVKLPTADRKKLVIQWIISQNQLYPTQEEKQIIDLISEQKEWISFTVLVYILRNVEFQDQKLFAAFVTTMLFQMSDKSLQKTVQAHQLNRSKVTCQLASQINNVCRDMLNLSNMMGISADFSKVFVAPKLHVQFDRENYKESMLFELAETLQSEEQTKQLFNQTHKLTLSDRQLIEHKDNYTVFVQLMQLMPKLQQQWSDLLQLYVKLNIAEEAEDLVEQAQQSEKSETKKQIDEFGGLMIE